MPPFIQPTTLLDLSLSAVRLALLDLCHQLHSSRTPLGCSRQLRQLFQQQLPAALRQRLLLQLEAGGGAAAAADTTVGYYMVGLLLAPDIGQLQLELCCYYGCTHQAALLKLLASPHATALTHLQLTRSALLRLDQCLLQSVLVNAEGLQQLTLRNIATDATLSAVGSSCKQLIQLDVANSRQITDQGIKQLCLQIELRNKTDRNNHCAVSITTTRRANFINRTARRLRHTLSLCLGGNDSSSASSDQCGDFLLDCFERQTALCDTLQVLNVTNTSCTSLGILIALENCTRLQSVGDYTHMCHALQLYEMRAERVTSSSLQLVTARNTITNHKGLQLIYKSCPRLQQLSVMDTRFEFNSPPLLHTTPPTLTSVTLLMVPPTQQWLTHFYRYANHATPCLRQLTLVFSAPVHVQLHQLMQACTRLQYLTIDGANIDYSPNPTPIPCYNLQKIQLGQNISSTVVNSLLAHCPHLTVAHFYNCPDLSQLTVTTHNRLQCFYIYQTRLADTGQAIATVLANCPQLEHLGNLANWPHTATGGHLRPLIASFAGANYKLQFESGAHWYHSKCIKHYE